MSFETGLTIIKIFAFIVLIISVFNYPKWSYKQWYLRNEERVKKDESLRWKG